MKAGKSLKAETMNPTPRFDDIWEESKVKMIFLIVFFKFSFLEAGVSGALF